MSKQPSKQEQLACDIALVCIVSMAVMKAHDIHPEQVGIASPDGMESLADVMARLRDAVAEMALDMDDKSKALAEQLLAKVGAA
jgi:hypothetical protein